MSKLEEDLASQLDAEGIAYEREVCVIPGRKFRFDFKFSDVCGENWLLEVQGGIFQRGGHSTGVGITRDMCKNNLATLLGYKILLVGSKEIKSGQAMDWIKEAIG